MQGTRDLQISRTSSLPSGMPVWQEGQTRDRQPHLRVAGALTEEAEDWEHPAHPAEGAAAQAGGRAVEVPSSHATGLLRRQHRPDSGGQMPVSRSQTPSRASLQES